MLLVMVLSGFPNRFLQNIHLSCPSQMAASLLTAGGGAHVWEEADLWEQCGDNQYNSALLGMFLASISPVNTDQSPHQLLEVAIEGERKREK